MQFHIIFYDWEKLPWHANFESFHDQVFLSHCILKKHFNFYMTKVVYLYIVVVFCLSCATKFTNPWKLMNFLLNQQLQGGNSVSYVKDSTKCKNFKKDFLMVDKALTPSWWRSLPYRNQSIDLQTHLNHSAKQWTGVYITGTSVMKELTGRSTWCFMGLSTLCSSHAWLFTNHKREKMSKCFIANAV